MTRKHAWAWVKEQRPPNRLDSNPEPESELSHTPKKKMSRAGRTRADKRTQNAYMRRMDRARATNSAEVAPAKTRPGSAIRTHTRGVWLSPRNIPPSPTDGRWVDMLCAKHHTKARRTKGSHPTRNQRSRAQASKRRAQRKASQIQCKMRNEKKGGGREAGRTHIGLEVYEHPRRAARPRLQSNRIKGTDRQRASPSEYRISITIHLSIHPARFDRDRPQSTHARIARGVGGGYVRRRRRQTKCSEMLVREETANKEGLRVVRYRQTARIE
ncbi:hypothetical protein C8R45DRAFT_946452 [Mycena sanguinolenta]|nr:hypothetical protein C8R45DRAFT_946452 [Mycena sanguinolenta]